MLRSNLPLPGVVAHGVTRLAGIISRHVVFVGDIRGAASHDARLGDLGCDAAAGRTETVTACGHTRDQKSRAAETVASTIIGGDGGNAGAGARGLAVAIDGRVDREAGAAATGALAIAGRGSQEPVAVAVVDAPTIAGSTGGKADAVAAVNAPTIVAQTDIKPIPVANGVRARVRSGGSVHAGVATFLHGATGDAVGINAVISHGLDRAGFNDGRARIGEINPVAQTARNRDVGHMDVGRRAVGINDAVDKTAAAKNSVIIGDTAVDMAVENGDVRVRAQQQNARAGGAGSRRGNREAIQIQRHLVGSDGDGVPRVDGEVRG